MKQIKWFERKFDFSKEQNIFPSIIERLKGTPILIEFKVSTISDLDLKVKFQDSWSIQDNIGHLIDLEPIWLGRLQDILRGDEMMRHIDLENTKTNLANHNSRSIQDILNDLSNIRGVLVSNLEKLTTDEVFKSSLHPRLNTPMRIMDLFLFVAEHDDHHLARINEIIEALKK